MTAIDYAAVADQLRGQNPRPRNDMTVPDALRAQAIYALARAFDAMAEKS